MKDDSSIKSNDSNGYGFRFLFSAKDEISTTSTPNYDSDTSCDGGSSFRSSFSTANTVYPHPSDDEGIVDFNGYDNLVIQSTTASTTCSEDKAPVFPCSSTASPCIADNLVTTPARSSMQRIYDSYAETNNNDNVISISDDNNLNSSNIDHDGYSILGSDAERTPRLKLKALSASSFYDYARASCRRCVTLCASS